MIDDDAILDGLELVDLHPLQRLSIRSALLNVILAAQTYRKGQYLAELAGLFDAASFELGRDCKTADELQIIARRLRDAAEALR